MLNEREIYHRKELFALKLVETFIEEIENNERIVFKQSQPQSNCGSSRVMDYAGAGIAFVPVIGPFAALGVLIVQDGMNITQAWLETKRAKERVELAKIIEYVIWDAAREIARVYEYQLSRLVNDFFVKELAITAAECLVYCDGYKKEPLSQLTNRDALLAALFYGKPKVNNRKLETTLNKSYTADCKTGESCGLWEAVSVFRKAGVRIKADEYYQSKDQTKARASKYGYRSQLLTVTDAALQQVDKAIPLEVIECNYSQLDEQKNIHKCYDQQTCVVQAQIVIDYANQRRQGVPKAQGTLNEFIGKIAVCRSHHLKGVSLEGGDFSKSDFSGTCLEGAKLRDTCWKSAILLGVSFKNADLQDAVFSSVDHGQNELPTHLEGADFDGAHLKSAKFYNASASNASFKDAQVDQNTDLRFCNAFNVDFEGTNLSRAIIGHSLADRIIALEAQLVQHQATRIYNDAILQCVSYYQPRLDDGRLVTAITYQPILALTGLPGSGKTQLSLRYAIGFFEKFPLSIAWLCRSASTETLLQDYKALLCQLAETNNWLQVQEIKRTDAVDKLTQWLREALEARKENFLLIYDNAPDLHHLNNYLLSDLHGKGQILITTLNQDFFVDDSDKHKHMRVTGFTREEALDFLTDKRWSRNLLDDITIGVAERLVEKLAHLPLGIAPAKLYIQNQNISLANYYQLLANENEKAIVEEDQQQYLTHYQSDKFESGSHLFAALRLAIRKAKFKQSQRLLGLCALLAQNQIPLELLKEAISCYGENMGEANLNRYLADLRLYSLIQVAGLDNHRFVSLHIITQQVMQSIMKENQQDFKTALIFLLESISKIFTKDTRIQAGFLYNRLLLPHVDSLLTHAEVYNDDQHIQLACLSLLDIRAYFYTQQGQAQHATIEFQKAFKLCEKLTGEKLPDQTANDSQWVAFYQSLKNVATSLPEQFISLGYSFGRQYIYLKDPSILDVAINYWEAALKIGQQLENETGRKLLQTMLAQRNGLLYLKLESTNSDLIQEAKASYIELLKDETAYFDKDKPEPIYPKDDTFHQIVCYHQLARAQYRLALLSEKSNYSSYLEEGLNYANRMLNIARATDAEKHWERMADYLNTQAFMLLAKYIYNREQQQDDESHLEQAQRMFEEAKDIEQKKNDEKGKCDFPLADAYFGVSQIFRCKKNFSEAELYIEKCIAIRQVIYPNNHPALQEAKVLREKIIEKRLAGNSPIFWIEKNRKTVVQNKRTENNNVELKS